MAGIFNYAVEISWLIFMFLEFFHIKLSFFLNTFYSVLKSWEFSTQLHLW